MSDVKELLKEAVRECDRIQATNDWEHAKSCARYASKKLDEALAALPVWVSGDAVLFNGDTYTVVPVATAGGTVSSWSDLFPCDVPKPGDEVVILRPIPAPPTEGE